MTDVEIVDGLLHEPYLRYPCVPGHEFCGSIEALGSNVTRLQVGDRVSVECVLYCGKCYHCQRAETHLCIHYDEIGFTVPRGGYSEYVEVEEDKAHKFIPTLDYEKAALTEPAAVAGHAIKRAAINKEDTVVVLGPGTVGLLCVSWAAMQKPVNLIVVGIDRANEEQAKLSGATHYITTNDDPIAYVKGLTQGRGADVVVEAAGSEKAVEQGIELVRRGGKVCIVGVNGSTKSIKFTSDFVCLNDLTIEGIFSYPSYMFVEALRAIERGDIPVSHFISHRFKLQEYAAALDVLRKKAEPTLKVMLFPSQR